MSAQNHYQMSCNYKGESGWSGWIEDDSVCLGDTWQDAIKNWLDDTDNYLDDTDVLYKSISATPSEDGKSGVIEITTQTRQGVPKVVWELRKIKATIIKEF